MNNFCEIQYEDTEENMQYNELIKKVIEECYMQENLINSNLYISITLTTPKKIKELNKEFRKIDKETDVLSFPMFEKEELEEIVKGGSSQNSDILGDMVISIPKVQEQAIEYGHSFERELSYMVVHSFYHLLGYDHIKEEDKKIMRQKEEEVLNKLKITRECPIISK